MRPQGPHEPWFPLTAAAALFIGVGVVGALLFGPSGLMAAALAGMAAGAGLHHVLTRAARQRLRALGEPFPPSWRRTLEEAYDHYDRLPSELRARFEDDIRIFLAEKRITGIDTEVTDELRLLVASSAVTLSLGWPSFEWDRVSEVLLYPQDFGRDYSFEVKELSGQAHAWGTVILSVPSLRESFADPDDAFHVGLHEFAHLLDMEQAEFDGIPAGFPSARVGEWLALVKDEMHRLQRGRSVIDDYGADDPVEFLAVAVEAFFEAPLLLRSRHRELYAILADYFQQDPAAWDEARGMHL